MTDKPMPKCPAGHEMALIQIAAGGWRYGCIRCATSFKARKTMSCGWLSPIKSTKERAREVAMKRPLQKPLTMEQANDILCHETALPPMVWAEFQREPCENRWITVADIANLLKWGGIWRAWAQKPTDEERAAAKWKEDNHEE